MIPHAASPDDILPKPRRARRLPGCLRLLPGFRITPTPSGDPLLNEAAQQLRRRLAPHLATVVRKPNAADQPAISLERSTMRHGDQAYALRIRTDGIRLRAADAVGFHYGSLTLSQLLAAGRQDRGAASRFAKTVSVLQCMDIDDRPDFPVRGVLLDISRDKVPTMSTLKKLIDLLAGWKINQIQLYMEHTFAYRGHEDVWRGAAPLTGPQIEALDRFCRERCVELVPNQNSFGHMERWLKHPRYRRLAECDGPWTTPWGEVRSQPATLNPLDPGSLRLVTSLYDQLLPHFSSRQLNVGCDEPWELGQGRSRRACRRRGTGRVYLEYLTRLHRAASKRGRRMMFWGDFVEQTPELIGELPDDVTVLTWGYEAEHPFGRRCAALRSRGVPFYVCPGTSSWCSIAGRTGNSLANLRNAAIAGARHGATGYLITDWGDFGHRQYLPVSYGPFLFGAALSWCVRSNRDIDLARVLSRHVFETGDPQAGRLWLDAGRVHERSRVVLNNRSVLFAALDAPLGDVAAVEGLAEGAAERMAARVDALFQAARHARFGGGDGALVREELLATLAVLKHACRRARMAVAARTGRRFSVSHRRLAREMERIIARHRALWLRRNRRGGLGASLSHYRRILNEYRA
ncbi:MAG: family 20 glycosylhydrolase [Phycisphaerae bacterium]